MNYTVKITLDDETLRALSNGFQMQAFKGVKASNPSGALPTVWTSVDSFSNTVTISWSESYGGYFSDTVVKQGVVVDTSTLSCVKFSEATT